MIIIWTRFGFLALIIPFALIWFGSAITPAGSIWDPQSAVAAKHFGYSYGALVAALILWPLGRWMNRPETHHEIDPHTGQMTESSVGGGNHTLFFVPLQYWAFVWVGLAIRNFFVHCW